MAEKDLFEFGMSVNVDVEKATLDSASKILDGFYKKYNNKKMKVDTSEMVSAVQNGVSKIQDLYKRGLDQKNITGVAWWEGQDAELENAFNEQLSLMKKFLGDAKVIFKDNSVFDVLNDNIVSVFTEKMSKGITVVAADLGERIDYLRERIKSSMDLFDAFGHLEYNQDGDITGFARDDMSERQLKERIRLVRDLIQSQRELETLSGASFDIYDSPSKLTTGDINDYLSNLNRMLSGLSAYNEQVDAENELTTNLFKKREKILRQVYDDYDQWGRYSQEDAIEYVHDDDQYLENISKLKDFINEREQLIETLRKNENVLFNDGGVEEYIQVVSESIQQYKNYIEDINKAKYGENSNTAGIENLSGVVAQLEEIRKAIVDIKNAFKPLTDALSKEDSALSAMVKANIADLELLNQKIEDTFNNIQTLSNKEFVSQTVISQAAPRNNALSVYRHEAQKLLSDMVDLAKQVNGVNVGGFKSSAGITQAEQLFSANFISDSDKILKDLKKKGNTVDDIITIYETLLEQLTYLRSISDKTNKAIELRNNSGTRTFIDGQLVQKPYLDEEKYNYIDTASVDAAKSVKDIDDMIRSSSKGFATKDNVSDSLDELESLKTKSQAIFSDLKMQLADLFDFSKLNPDYSYIENIVENIYQKFVELQSRINGLKLNINIPEISTDIKADEKNIDSAADAMKEEGKSADDAVPKKNAFTEANERAAQSMKETGEAGEAAVDGIKAEAKAVEQSAGKIVEASEIFDKIKYVDSIDAETGKHTPISRATTSTDKRERAYETEITHFTYDEDLDKYIADAVTVVKDFKKRSEELKKETAKIELAKKTVAKFLSQFDNKTAGHGSDIAGYNELKGFNIDSLDAIEEAMQKMIALDTKYNELTRDFRKGTKSMNPFVNAFNSMDEMRNKVKSVQLDFENLKSPTDILKNQVKGLPELLNNLESALKPDANNVINIKNIAKAYGELNAAIKQVNSSIGLQRKEERINTASSKEEERQIKNLHKLYEEQAQSAAKISEYRKQLNSGDLGKEEARLVAAQLHQEKTQFASIQQKIRAYGNLYNSIEQVATITHELYMTELKLNAASEKKAQKVQQQEELSRKKQEEKHQKDVDNAYNNSLQLLEKIYATKKKLVGVDAESSKGMELNRRLSALQEEYDATTKILDVERRRALFKERVKMQSELTTKEGEYREDGRKKQEIDDTEYLVSLYKEYTSAALKLKKMQSDTTGKVHDNETATEVQNVQKAKQALLGLGIDVNKIADSELLTEQQINALLEERINYKKQLKQIEDSAADKALTKEQKEQQKQDRQNQNYGKTIYNRELRNSESINAKASLLGDDISPELSEKIKQYQNVVNQLEQLRNKFAKDPSAIGNSTLKNQFQSAALEAEKLRKEILGVFKESQKLGSVDGFAKLKLDSSDLSNVKSKMIEFASEVSNGKFEFKGFNAAGTEMYGVLNKGNGVIEEVTVALDKGTNTLHMFSTGTKQVKSAWDQVGASLQKGVQQLAYRYLSFYDILRVFRNGLKYVKEIDLALTELKKVTDETEDTYKNFLQTASQSSSIIGSTVSDFTEATANFARLGYSIDESTKLAETAIVYKNVADGLDSVEESTESIISTMMAFGIEANDTMGIVDRFNAVGNSFAITSAGIGDALQRSASALYEAGNTIDESVALVTAANSVIQNPEQVGTALKTLALRLRGAKVELEEAGLDAENMAESTSTLQEKLKALTHGKVDIMLDANTFKSTTQILREMSDVWENMTDIEQASALELMGGKRQANILSSLISNFETVEDVIVTSMNSSGSAMAENEKWLDSIAGKTEQFSNTLQTFWMNLIDSDVVKSFVDFGTDVIKFLDSAPGKITAIVVALAGLAKFKGFSLIGLGKDAGKSLQNYQQAILKLQSLSSVNIGMDESYNASAVLAYAQAVDGLTAKKQAELLATVGLNKAQIVEVMTRNNIDAAVAKEIASKMNLTNTTRALQTATVAEVLTTEMATDATQEKVIADFLAANGSKKLTAELLNQMVNQKILTAEQAAGILANHKLAFSWTALGNSIKAAFMSNPVGVILTIITSVISLTSVLKGLGKTTEDVAKAADEAVSKYKQIQTTLQEQKKTVDELSASYKKLSKGVDLNTNENINLTTESYKEYLEVCNDIADLYPNLVTGFDSQGNAIISLKGNVDSLTQAYREAAQAARQQLIASGVDIFDSFKNSYNSDPSTTFGDTGLLQQVKLAKKLQELINSASDSEIKEFFSELQSGVGIEIDGDTYTNVELMDTLKSIGIKTNWLNMAEWQNVWTGAIDVEKFKEKASKINSFVKSNTTSINTETSKVVSLMSAYLGEDLDYVALSDKSKSFINQIVASLDAEFVDGFDNADQLYNHIKTNIVSVFQDSSVIDAISSLSDLQLEFLDGELSYSDYKNKLNEYVSDIQNKVDEDTLNQIKIGIGIDEQSLQTSIQHAVTLLGGVGIENVYTLSSEDLQIAGQLEVPDGTILSWQELQDEIKKTKIAATQDFDITNFTDAISDHSATISEYQEAIQKLDKGSFTMNDFMELIKKYPDLAKGVDISSNAFYGLSRNLNKAIKTSTKSFIKDLKELKTSLIAAGKSTDSIDQLIEAIENMPDDALDDIIEKYSTLADKINKAKLAQDKLTESMGENPNEGYETRGEAMEYMKEAMSKGEIGSESNLWNVANKYGFTYDSAKTINENADALAKFIATRERWFKTEDDGDDRTSDDGYSYEGTENFIKDVESALKSNEELQKYLAWNYDEDTGTLDFNYDNKNWDTIVSILSKTKELAGLTSEEFSDLMIQVGQYFNIEWGDYNDAIDHLDEIANSTDDAKTKAEEYGKYMQEYFGKNTKIDLTSRPMVSGENVRLAGWNEFDGDYGTLYSSGYQNKDGSIIISATPILPDGEVLDPKSLEKYATEIANGAKPAELTFEYKGKTYTGEDIFLNKFTGPDAAAKEDQYGSILSKAQTAYDGLRDTLGINATLAKSGVDGLKNISELQGVLQTNSYGVTVIDEDAFTNALVMAEYTEDQIDLIVDKIKTLNKNAFNIDPFNIDETLINKGVAGLEEIQEIRSSFAKHDSTGLTFFDTDVFAPILKEAGYTKEQIDSLIKKIQEYNNIISVSGNVDPLGLSTASFSIDSLKASLDILGIAYDEVIGKWGDKKKDLKINVQDLVSTLVEKGWTEEAIKNYCTKLSETNLEGFNIKVNQDEIDAAIQKANEVPEEEKTEYKITGTGFKDLQNINKELSKIPSRKETKIVVNEVITKTTDEQTVGKNEYGGTSGVYTGILPLWERLTGADNVNGTANAYGNWGVSKTETSLVGELGPELLVRGNRWTTVGENGAEFTQVKKGDIIFNHKQTEQLLKNGHVASRGKAYAGGTAYSIGDGTFSSYEFSGSGGYQKFDVNGNVVDSWGDLTGAVGDAADAADEFSETLDWIEIRMEEIDEVLGLLGAKLENATSAAGKNDIIDEMVSVNKQKYLNASVGATYYNNYLDKYWNQIPDIYQEWAKNGYIAVTDFAGDANEAVVEAINKYREYAQKAADLTQQAEETITEIKNLAIQRIDNAYESGKVRADVEDSQTEKLQNRVDLDEARGQVTSDAYYIAMMENSNKKIEYLTSARNNMQAEFDKAVRNGELIRGSNEWYEKLNELYGIDAEIAEATIEIEEFNNAINDIYWDNFENLTNQISYLKDQTQSLIDLMENSGDLVAKPNKKKHDGGDIEYWTADDVKWTDEGLASLGLYAQQMEIAEFEAKQYAEAIDDLEKQYADGRYSESEYLEKLEELTSAQYDSIETYYDARDAIIELNEARIDTIKDGIEKEIDAYEELIEKKKEALKADKDAHDFEKSVMDKQKDISEIKRKLDALEFDTSTSAMAQKARLEAELAEASSELQEIYLDKSISDQEDALDKELEDFQTIKDKEIEKWEKYLDDVELVITDSLNTIQANATNIYDILSGKAQEYDLTLSDAIMSPWKDGALAVDDYQDHFGRSMSSTMDQLNTLKSKWQEVIREITEAGRASVDSINKQNAAYASATQQYSVNDWSSSNNNYNNSNSTGSNQQSSSGAITVGGKVNAGSATIYQNSAGGGGSQQYFSNDPIYTVLDEQNGYILVRHHSVSSGFSGWFKKSDVKALASGTTNLNKSGIVNIDELGEELVIRAQNGRLTYMEKGSGVIPASLTENLMEWGKLDPTSMIEQNRPTITAPVVQNKEINIDLTYGDILHIEEFHGDDPENIAKIIEKQFEKHTKNLNNAIRKFAR